MGDGTLQLLHGFDRTLADEAADDSIETEGCGWRPQTAQRETYRFSWMKMKKLDERRKKKEERRKKKEERRRKKKKEEERRKKKEEGRRKKEEGRKKEGERRTKVEEGR